MKTTPTELKNPLPVGAHNALVTIEDYLRGVLYGEAWRGVTAQDAFAAVRRELNTEKYGTAEPPPLTVTPAASFQPPETCPDCAAGVPFGIDGHHVNRNEGRTSSST